MRAQDFRHKGTILMVAGDIALVNLAILASLALRFDGHIPRHFYQNYLLAWLPLAAVTVVCMHLNGLYRGIWRYAGLRTLVSVARAVTLAVLTLAAWRIVTGKLLFPRSATVLIWFLEIAFLGALRMSPRLWRELASGILGPLTRGGGDSRKSVLIVGAGDMGASVVREMLQRPDRGFSPVGFVDDNPAKIGADISGVRVLGSTVDIPRIVRETGVSQVLIAAPSAPSRLTRDILAYCRHVQIECLTLPALQDYMEGRTPLNQIRQVRIQDVVGREQVEVDLAQVTSLLAGKCILVTGAGGSIGSEICRQIARMRPRRILLLDHAENGLYFCYRDLAEDGEAGRCGLSSLVADIKDRDRLFEIFREHRPEVVFHAAAHKHVPLLEENPREAVLNNICGTRNLIDASVATGVECFVQISTDKAVRPTSMMGASKRVCEMLVAAAAQSGRGQYVSVRFGNVMDSEGSVIPLFRRQIARGGPVTITHPDARRYFMTIPEAVRLVLQAAALGRNGEIFLLDMGEPVRILDLAEQVIRLSGFVPGRDIEIREIGLRAGEKMVEQLVSEGVPARQTEHDRIKAYSGDPVDPPSLERCIDRLVAAALASDREALVECMEAAVPDFQPPTHSQLPAAAAVAAGPLDDPAVAAAALTLGGPAAENVLCPPARLRRAARLSGGAKRATDLLAACLLLPFALIAMGLISLVLAVELGPPLFERDLVLGRNRRQEERRRGTSPTSIDRRIKDRRRRDLLGVPIILYRFRTTADAACGRSSFAVSNPRFARFCRAHGLDRLPWLFAVLDGRMSMVGPEPLPVERLETHARRPDSLALRFALRPGFTGLAQVLAPRGTLAAKLGYDLYYLGHLSPLLDLRIAARGLHRAVRGVMGAESGARPPRPPREPRESVPPARPQLERPLEAAGVR